MSLAVLGITTGTVPPLDLYGGHLTKDKVLRTLESQLGPRGVLRLLRSIAHGKNNHETADEFELSLWRVQLLRLKHDECMLYALGYAERALDEQMERQKDDRIPDRLRHVSDLRSRGGDLELQSRQ